MNNYFGIGLDAKISLDFNNKRDEHPEKCRWVMPVQTWPSRRPFSFWSRGGTVHSQRVKECAESFGRRQRRAPTPCVRKWRCFHRCGTVQEASLEEGSQGGPARGKSTPEHV